MGKWVLYTQPNYTHPKPRIWHPLVEIDAEPLTSCKALETKDSNIDHQGQRIWLTFYWVKYKS